MSRRLKYDYKFIIDDFELNDDFEIFYSKHKNISYNRAARSFLIHIGLNYKKPCYVVGQTRSFQTYVSELIRSGEIEVSE